jgi:LuxR family transcriptional regulator, maltose regulon positive regulatory protein
MRTAPITSSRKGAAPSARVTSRAPRRRGRPRPHLGSPASTSPYAGQDEAGAAGDCPPLPESFIRRPRLVDRLLKDHEASLVLLAAPAGYGKTSTLSEWAARSECPFAWVALEEADNDSQHLLTTLALAIEQLQSTTGRFTVGSAVPRPQASTLPSLIRTLRALRAGAVLVLDDAQLVRSRESLGVLARLAGAMPTGTKLALASRTAPVLSVARLRARHELLTLGVPDLAMTLEEAGSLLAAAGHELPADQLELVVRRTEGWPAVLYLAAIALGEQSDAAVALERFSGDDEVVSQYIREELLAQMPSEALTFLMDTAILDELSPELCDAVLARKGSGLALRTVAASNLLVAPLDRGHRRYRCHPLVREVLQAELSRVDCNRAARLHRTAARWLGEHGELEQALRHAGAGGDLTHVGRLLWAHAPRALSEGHGADLRSSLSTLSDEQIASVPTLALTAAHYDLCSGNMRRAAHWARVASVASGSDPHLHEIAGFASGLAVVEAAVSERGLECMSSTAGRGVALADEGSPWRAACCLLSGVSQHLSGERMQARAMLSEGARCGAVASPGIQGHCLSQLAMMAAEDEDWESAEDLAERARVALERAGLCEHPTSALILAGFAWIASHRGRADEAKRDLGRSRRMLATLEDFIPWYEVETRVLLARTAIRLADVVLARTQLSQASRLARRMPEIVVFRAWFDEAWGKLDGVSAAALDGPSSLTMAELRILRFLPTHLSFREIGSRLHVSTNTVKSQVHAVYGKLDAGSRSEAVEHASMLGLIDVCI